MVLYFDLLWVASGRIVTALITIASLRIMTSLLDPKDYGHYTLLIAFQGFCGLILISPVGLHINRHTHTWWDEGTLLKRLIRYNRYLLAISAGIALVVLMWGITYPSANQKIPTALLSACAVSAMVYMSTWNGTFITILNMLGHRIGSIGWMLASTIIGLGCASLFAYVYQTGTSWLLGQALGMTVGAVGAGFTLRNYQAAKKMVDVCSNNLSTFVNLQTIQNYCLPLAVATGLMWLQNAGYRFWVEKTWGPTELGLLAVGLSITSQIWNMFESLSMQFLNPYFFRQITILKSISQKSVLLSDLVNVLWPIYAVLAGFNIVFASSILAILTNERYHTDATFVLIGVIIEFARCTGNLWSYAAQIERRSTKYILPYALGAMIVIGGVLGLSAAPGNIEMFAICLGTSGLVICGAMVITMQRMVPVKLDIYKWLAGTAVLLVCVAAGIFMPLKTDGLLNTILQISVGLFVSGGVMLALLWNDPALKRLLAVSLRGP